MLSISQLSDGSTSQRLEADGALEAMPPWLMWLIA
jgi:hypothetical protein